MRPVNTVSTSAALIAVAAAAVLTVSCQAGRGELLMTPLQAALLIIAVTVAASLATALAADRKARRP